MLKLKWLFGLAIMVASKGVYSQEKKDDGTWWDNDLKFELVYEDIRRSGELEFCVYKIEHERCIYNVQTGFEVRVFDESGEEIWNSLWSGKKTAIKFKKPLKEAYAFEVKAIRPFVININTGTRIYQDEPLVLKHTIVDPE